MNASWMEKMGEKRIPLITAHKLKYLEAQEKTLRFQIGKKDTKAKWSNRARKGWWKNKKNIYKARTQKSINSMSFNGISNAEKTFDSGQLIFIA